VYMQLYKVPGGVINAPSGERYFSSRCQDPPLPAGSVPLQLPLTAAEAKKLAAHCSPAPFGRGSKTVFDEKVSQAKPVLIQALCVERITELYGFVFRCAPACNAMVCV